MPALHPVTSDDLVKQARAKIHEVDPVAFHSDHGVVVLIDVREPGLPLVVR
ncbi:MAG: hypothetical protein ACOH1L_10295 [Thermomonas sp.]